MTRLIYEADFGTGGPMAPMDPGEVIRDLLDPIDVEDLVLFLQSRGWLLLPSTRMHDTPLYEAAFRHRDDGRVAVVSVKSGTSAYVPVADLAEANPTAEVYVFSTESLYTDPPETFGVHEITLQVLIAFMFAHPKLLPPRISRWLEPR